MTTHSSDIPLPPAETFDSYDDLKRSILDQGRLVGVAYVISKNNLKKERREIVYNCKKSGKDRRRIRDEDLRLRQRSTFREECSVSFKVREQLDGTWVISHRGPQYSTHNHIPAPPGTFPEHRRLDTVQQQAIQAQFVAGITASRTVAILRHADPQIQVSHRDIYNVTAELGRAQRLGHSPIEALINRLEREKEEGTTHFEWRRDIEGHVSMLFVANTR